MTADHCMKQDCHCQPIREERDRKHSVVATMGEQYALLEERALHAEKRRIQYGSELGNVRDILSGVEKERNYLLDKHSKFIRDALDGQAALDEANNKVISVEKLEAVLRKDALQYAEFMRDYFISVQDFDRAKGAVNWIEHFTLEVEAPKE